jgi:hypothetical protein
MIVQFETLVKARDAETAEKVVKEFGIVAYASGSRFVGAEMDDNLKGARIVVQYVVADDPRSFAQLWRLEADTRENLKLDPLAFAFFAEKRGVFTEL